MAARFAFIAIMALCLLGAPTRAFGDGDGTIPPISAGSGVICGSEGKRVQAVYVHTADKPSHYADYLLAMRNAAWQADYIFDVSAHLTGGHRHIRWVMTGNCEIDVIEITIPQGFDSSLAYTEMILRLLGHTRADRKYLMFVDSSVFCGMSNTVADDTPGPDNLSNHIVGYARVDFGCWNGRGVAHEITHMLGGVQQSAPNSDGGWHCTDDFDVMCESSPPNYMSMRYKCLSMVTEWRLDCNSDDYFNVSPEAGSYLATHWNVADSAFLSSDEQRVYLAMVMQ